MQKLNYDYYNNIEVPTFVLSNVYHHHIGMINNIDIESIQYSFNMNARQEVSFDIYKELNGEKCDLWDKIIDLKYVYIPEHDEYYVLAVSTDDSDNTVKHCSLTSAGEYELSNKIIRSLEINTETDILRNVNDTNIPPNPTYAPNVLCNFDDPDNSILHRALKDKAPDWSVAHCDETIAHIQRTFTVTNQKIYDFLTGTLAKEYDCLFQFDSVNRTISCYDLLNICEDCGERGEFVYECPNCGSKKIHYGYGKNTNIFITYNNFSEKITRDGDEGAVKNCFHVTGGDDYMSDTLSNINPNGTPYIYNFSEQDYEDMPPKLRQGLEEYQKKYDELYEPYQEITAKWYDAKNNYYFYKTSMMPRGDNTLWEANHGYKLGDEIYVKTLASWAYLKCVKVVGDSKSGNEEFDATGVINGQLIQDNNVTWEVCKNIITPSSAEQSYNDIVTYFQSNQIYFLTSIPTALTQVNNEVVNMSQLQINNLYKVTIISDGKNKVEGTKWYGRLRVTNSGNEKDTYTSEEILEINLHVVNNGIEYASYMEDKVVKRINRTDKTFINLYEIPLDENDRFKALLTQYGLDSLSSFSKSYQNCIDVLIANGIKDENSTYMAWNTYDGIYLPTYNRKTWVDEELAKREATVNKWYELDKEYSLQMSDIHDQLKLENFLLDPEYIDPRTHEKDPYVWIKAFYNYVREDTYTNSNYISTGLSDGEVINNAKQLFKIAEKELKKACELQVTLNDTIKNLLNTDEFKNYKDKYNLGDFIFVECDGDDWEDNAEKNRGLYRLRLISASYSFGSPGDINFTFSNVTKVQNFFSDAQSIINSAQTISGSYNAVVHQVKNNSDTSDLVNTWTNEGLESAKSIIANNNNEEVTMGEYGIYAKEYDDIKDEYSPEQLRITHNNITFTDDNWETAALAIGKNTFRYYNTDVSQGAIGWITKTDYGVNAKFLEAGYVIGGQIIGSEVVSTNYHVADPEHGIEADGSFIDLNDGSFSLGGGGLIGYKDQETGAYYLNYNGNFTGIVDVDVGSELGVWTVGADGFYSGTSVLKPSDISVTGNIRAADFYVGTSTTTTLSSILNGKQDTLIPGTNITIDPTTNTISASSGTEVEANPSGTPTDTLTTIEIDNTIYDIDGGTDVEANPVETATDTLNSIKIDDTVYEIVGGTGGVEMHQGIDVPDSSLGNNDDIYLQMKSTIGNLLSFDASHSGAAITNYSATVTDNKWDITATFVDNWEYHSFAVYSLQNLTVGKKYTISFDFQNDGTPPLYGIGELFGLTLQHSNRVIDMRNWSSDLVENGEFKYFENSYYGEWWYQSFPNDTKRVHYEFEFTARQGTEYIGFYGDRTSGNLTCSLYELCVGDKVQTNEIKDVYYKLNNQWSIYDRNVTLYHGLQSPSYDLGNDADIYIQLAPDSNSLQILHDTGGMNGELNYTFTNNNRVYEYKAEYNHSQWHDGRIFLFFPDDLEEGKTYLVHFDAQSVDGSWSGSGDRNQSRFYGLAYQKQNNILIHNGTQYEHVANGGFEYLSQFGDGIYYQSFFYDHEKHTYEFEFVATHQGYLCFYADDFVPNEHHHIEITNFYVVGMDAEGSEINKTYYKLNDEWVENESGKTYEAGDNIQISDDNVISATDTTYDNFEGTDGTEDGASGLVPPPLTTDVNKFLKSDGTWAEVQGGSGNVADVYVNGTSVLDANDIAQVFSHEEITESNYDNLPSTKFSDNHMYLIKEAGTPPTGEYYNPVIYSTEEREVGVWIDNKPLYQKSVTCGSITNRSSISLGIENVEHISFVPEGSWINDGDRPLPYVIGSDASNNIGGYFTIGTSDTSFEVRMGNGLASDSRNGVITVQYTKTTDVAGSGRYNTLGVPNVHYTTDEQVIGTWIDGKPLYQKTIAIHNESAVSSYTTITTIDSTFRVKNWKAFAIENGVSYKVPYVAGSGNAYFYFRENGNVEFTITNTSFAAGSDFYITIEYTKTTD